MVNCRTDVSDTTKKVVMRIMGYGFWAMLFVLASLSSPAIAQVQFEVERFIVEGNNPVGSAVTESTLAPFVGSHTGIDRLQQAATALEKVLNGKGYDFHRVTLPPQVLESGAVVLEIRNLIIGEISTSGNKHFSDQNLLRSLPQLSSAETPNTRALSRALAVANFNTAKRTRLTFGRGSDDNTLDARIEVRDRPPQQVYGWLNNTGTEETTRTRVGIGYQHRNVLDRDHNLTATFTSSPERSEDVQQYGVNYQIPLYALTGTLGLFHVKSDIDSGRVADAFDVNGGGETTGIRYSQVLNKIGEYRQRVYIDVVDKLFDNNVDFQGTDIGVDVRSRPLGLTWQLEWDRPLSSGRVNATWSTNLSGGSLNDQASYTAARVGAPRNWDSLRFNFNQDFNLPEQWTFGINILGQYTSDPLISGEQLGLGGSQGPRGFEEREVGVDRGANLKLQVWAPPFANNIQFGGFIDYGYGTRLNPQPGEVSDRELSSAGVAAKWQWNNRLVATIDIGYVLQGLEEPTLTQDGDSQAHVSLVYRFTRD